MKGLRFLFGSALFLMMSSVAAMAQSIQTDYDHSFNLGRLKTFDFHQQARKPGDPLSASPMNDRRIHNAIDTQLRANGFSAMTTGPDFLISYYVTTRKGLDIRDNPFGLFQRMGSVNVNQITEGYIVVVFVDCATQQEVWRGYVTGTIDLKDLDQDVNKGIAKLGQKFVKRSIRKEIRSKKKVQSSTFRVQLVLRRKPRDASKMLLNPEPKLYILTMAKS